MYVDADAFFYRDALPLHDLIVKADTAMPGWELILSRDLGGGAPAGARTKETEMECCINDGVFIARSSPRVQCILHEWDTLKQTIPDEQVALRQLWLKDACSMRASTYVMEY